MYSCNLGLKQIYFGNLDVWRIKARKEADKAKAFGTELKKEIKEDTTKYIRNKKWQIADTKEAIQDHFTRSNKGRIFKDAYYYNNRHYPYEISNFDGATFERVAVFNNTTFEDKASFVGAYFDDAGFADTTFKNGADFSNAIFERGASFAESNFPVGGYFDFSGAQFNGGTSFWRSTLRGNFDGCKFSDNVDFNSAEFTNALSFKDALFEGDFIDFSNTNIAEFKNVFKGAKYKKGMEIVLPGKLTPEDLEMIEV